MLLSLSQIIPGFYGSGKNRLLKTLWEKEKMPVTGIFSISHHVFYPSHNKYHFFLYIYFVICKCFELGQVKNFAVWERVKYTLGTSILLFSYRMFSFRVTLSQTTNFRPFQTQRLCRRQF